MSGPWWPFGSKTLTGMERATHLSIPVSGKSRGFQTRRTFAGVLGAGRRVLRPESGLSAVVQDPRLFPS